MFLIPIVDLCNLCSLCLYHNTGMKRKADKRTRLPIAEHAKSNEYLSASSPASIGPINSPAKQAVLNLLYLYYN